MPTYITRLNATQLNNLNLSYIIGHAEDKSYTVTDASIEIKESNKLNIKLDYKHVSHVAEVSFCVFPATSDKRQQQNLAFINDVIQQFEQANPTQQTTLLIPLMQSRLWKKHCVLAEVTIRNDSKEIDIHDSQSWWRNLFYPNCLKGLKKQGYIINDMNYDKQKDHYSCAYFVYHYIKTILEKSSDGLKNIFVSLNLLHGKDPIGKLTQNNFKQQYPDLREMDSGEPISWNQKGREKNFTQKYTEKNNEDGFIEINNPVNSEIEKLNNGNKRRTPFFHSGSVAGENQMTDQKLTLSR